MEPFLVSARKYRPIHFKDVVGQTAITETLEKAIAHDHLAQALLFCGPRGVGKTSCARILAKKINEQQLGISTTEDYAFNIFELDAASNNSVDDIRNLVDQVRIPPQKGAYKVYIIDEVHMLSAAAFNAFLKTLEEPPKHAIFILATTEKHKIIPTILSRCQIYDFKRITVKDIAQHLGNIATDQGITADPEALHLIAQKADGALRDALSIFDRIVSYTGKTLSRQAVSENLNILDYDTYFTATDFITAGDIPSVLLLFNDAMALGFDGHHFIQGLAAHLRDLVLAQFPETISLMEVGAETQKRYHIQTKKIPPAFLLQALEIANHCDLQYKNVKNQRLLVELALMKMSSIINNREKKNSTNQVNPAITITPAQAFEGQKPLKTNLKTTTPTTTTPLASGLTETPNEALPDVTPSAPVKEITTQPTQETQAPSPKQTGMEFTNTTLASEQASALANSIKTTPSTALNNTAPPRINIEKKEGVSGLSIASLKAKKSHEALLKNAVKAEKPKMADTFSETQMQEHWANYVRKIEKEGQKIIASNLNANLPKLLEGFVIAITLPNDTMKKEVERAQSGVLNYLKKELNNERITLQISVSDTTQTKYAFTPEEKYEKIKEKNPAVDLLRKSFNLDLK